MGKHETSYPRVNRDHYPTPAWCVDALAEHVDLAGLTIWESAADDGRLAEALRAAGAAHVHCTDIATGTDFLVAHGPPHFDMIATNPPYGERGALAEAFIETGLSHLVSGGRTLALLLPVDFDSAKRRARFFRDCPYFTAKIILTRRIVWFARTDGKREAPKENHGWFLWSRSLLRCLPATLYAPKRALEEFRHEPE
jgi:hypothetical protein